VFSEIKILSIKSFCSEKVAVNTTTYNAIDWTPTFFANVKITNVIKI